jgi:hypothetical protein
MADDKGRGQSATGGFRAGPEIRAVGTAPGNDRANVPEVRRAQPTAARVTRRYRAGRNGDNFGSVYRRTIDGRWAAVLYRDGKRVVFYGATKREATLKRELADW